jgi:hypothetical protein
MATTNRDTQCRNPDYQCCHILGLVRRIIMGSGVGDWIYWRFFAVTVDYNSSHTELLLNDVCLPDLNESLELISTAPLICILRNRVLLLPALARNYA